MLTVPALTRSYLPIPTSLFLYPFYEGIWISCFLYYSMHIIKMQQFGAKQRCRDGVMNDFLSWSRHLLVPFLFHDLTSLHPPSFHGNDFSTCKASTDALIIIFHGNRLYCQKPEKKSRICAFCGGVKESRCFCHECRWLRLLY